VAEVFREHPVRCCSKMVQKGSLISYLIIKDLEVVKVCSVVREEFGVRRLYLGVVLRHGEEKV
jgi:hypothetical protein